MNKELRKRIKQWNDIKYGTYNTDKPLWNTVIMFKTLKPAIDYTIVWKDGTKTFQNPDGTVTTAPKIKE